MNLIYNPLKTSTMKMNRQIILASTMALTMTVVGCKEQKKNDADTDATARMSTEEAAPDLTLKSWRAPPHTRTHPFR